MTPSDTSISVRGREWNQYVGVCGKQQRERGRRRRAVKGRAAVRSTTTFTLRSPLLHPPVHSLCITAERRSDRAVATPSLMSSLGSARSTLTLTAPPTRSGGAVRLVSNCRVRLLGGPCRPLPRGELLYVLTWPIELKLDIQIPGYVPNYYKEH